MGMTQLHGTLGHDGGVENLFLYKTVKQPRKHGSNAHSRGK